jgi:murein DD-endopeptidase MepM/ murein hydrolase activator NlpD
MMVVEDGRSRVRPEVAAAGVILIVAAGVWFAFFGANPDNHPAPTAAAQALAPIAPAGWVAPVQAEIWGGFRTVDNPTHDGIDLGAARGTPIHAAAAGVVVRAKCDTKPASWGCDRDGSPQVHGCGWYVDIRHDGGIYTRYCHMNRQPDVAVGQTVTAGQVIGQVGSTGNSSAPHLHFEVHLGDENSATATDPVAFMAAHAAPLGLTHPATSSAGVSTPDSE